MPKFAGDAFAKARAGVGLQDPVAKGLFAQVAEANRSIQTATDFGERAVNYTERMPRILQWQTERIVQAVLENPDLKQILASTEQVSRTVAEEIARFSEQQAEIQKTLEQASQIAVNGTSFMAEARQTGEAFTETSRTIEQLVRTIKPPLAPGQEPPRKFDIREFGAAFESGTAMAHEARLFVESSLRLEASPEFNKRMSDIERASARGTDHIALRGAQLIVLFFAMLSLSVLHEPAQPQTRTRRSTATASAHES